MCFTGILVLCCTCASCSSVFFIMCMDCPTGTEVNRAVTSYDMMHSLVLSLMFLMPSLNSCVLCTLCIDCLTDSFSILASSSATPLLTAPLLEIYVPKGAVFLYFWKSIELRRAHSCGYMLLYMLSSIPLSVLIFRSRLISFFCIYL